jgi:hypothetical protein
LVQTTSSGSRNEQWIDLKTARGKAVAHRLVARLADEVEAERELGATG